MNQVTLQNHSYKNNIVLTQAIHTDMIQHNYRNLSFERVLRTCTLEKTQHLQQMMLEIEINVCRRMIRSLSAPYTKIIDK